MNYKITSARISFKDGKMSSVETTWETNPGTRTTYVTNKPCTGYMYIRPGDTLSEEYLQKVAGQGMDK